MWSPAEHSAQPPNTPVSPPPAALQSERGPGGVSHPLSAPARQCRGECSLPGRSDWVPPPCTGHCHPPDTEQPREPPRVPWQRPARRAQTPEQLEARREAAREKMRAAREKQTPELLEARREAAREKKRTARAQQTPEQLEARREAAREKMRAAREKQTPELLEARREAARERKRTARAQQTPEQLEARREAARERKRTVRAQQTPEQLEARREAAREKMRAAREKQTPELLEARREAARERKRAARSGGFTAAAKRKSLTPEQRNRSNELRRARRQAVAAATESNSDAQDVLDEEREKSPIPILWSSRDDGLVYDREAGSEPESLGGDFDDSSTEEEGDDDTARELTIPNDPLIVVTVRQQVNQALTGVCAARCFVCDRMLNTRAVRRINLEKLKANDKLAVTELLDHIVTVPGKYDMCATCHRYVLKKTVPPSAAVNGFRYPTMPPGLRPLTEVEEHIVALRLPFQQIMHLGTMGTRGQYGVRGSVVNVPNDAQDTVRTVIPLLPEEDRMCIVNIKRKLVHKRAFASSFVDKENMIQWCRFLRNSTLYREHKVTFDEDRLADTEGEERPAEPTTNNEGELFFDQPDEPANQEDMFQRFGSIQHSLLMEDRLPAVAPVATVVPKPAVPAAANQDYTSSTPAPATPTPAPGPSRANPDTDEVDVAPGEHKTPISVVWDRKAEELSFPAIYLGEPRTFSRRVTRYQAMRSEVRRFDRRGARPVSVLYKYNLHAREQASSRLRHKFKRGARRVLGASITKEQLLDDKFVATSQKKGLAMPCLLPNSSEYWRSRAHDLFAMVRQLKCPHLFFTQSFSETNCKPLMKVLRKLHREHGEMDRASAANIDSNVPLPAAVGADVMEAISDLIQYEEVEDIMASQEKLKLVREDPIVCAMMFREIVLQLKKYLRMKKKGPMGKYYMTDWFIRIEFQQRGAPHCHGLLWLNEGPNEPLKDIEGAVRFADELLTCDSTHPLAERNRHNHTTTCFRKKNIQRRFRLKQLDSREAHRHCRFDAPFWPTPRTRILSPLSSDEDVRPEEDRGDCSWEDYVKSLQELRLRLKDVLSTASCPNTLEAVWQEAGCPNDRTYELAIRTGLKHVKMIYKRTVQDRWTNPFLRWVLDVLEFNTDAQVVLDVYSLVRYCVSYVTKAEKNHSQLHNEITNLRREHGFDDRTLMRMLASRCLRSKETSAQEASWVLLNFPLSEMSRKCTFIDTSLPDERHHCPKPKHDIAALPDGATDLWYPDVFDMYANRHEDLANTTLAEFVAVHHQSNKKPRKKDRIIRYRRFNEHSDDKDQRENFYRGMCTLHIPWRNEQDEILSAGAADGGFNGLYERHEADILPRRARFEAMLGHEDDMEDVVQNVVAEDEAEANEATEAARRQLAGDSKYVFEEAEFMDDGAQDIDMDLPEPRFDQPRSDPVATVRRRGIWDRDTFLYNIRRLNSKQREVVLAVYDGVRLNSEPLLLFIDGAAGTGKSLVAQCCANAFDTFAAPSDKSSATRVISCAPTGKAACIIGGMTIHNSHKLSYNQEAGATERLRDGDGPMRPLQGEQLANLQNFFLHVEAQLIDEISMVSDRNFLAIDQRSREAKGKETDFGGLWTIVFGDFRQLTPVGGSAVYLSSTTEVTGSAALWQKFQYVELTQNMRQGEDKKYAELLAIIGDADKSLSEADCALIETRFVEKNNLIVPADVPRLYHFNMDKDKYNTAMLLRAEIRNIFRVIARDRIQSKLTYQDCSAGRRQRREVAADTILQRAMALNVADAHGLPYELLAVVGRPYKLTFNKDTADQLVNGAVGTLVWVQLGVLSGVCLAPSADSSLAVHKLWIRFPGNSGALASRAAAGELRRAIQQQANFPPDMVTTLPFDLPPCPVGDELNGLVPIERRDLPLRKVWVEKWRQVLRQQFPLTPAFADTIHSSQGSSYDAACVDYDPGMTNEMVYVALSRVRSLNGLYMTYSKRSKSMRKMRDGQVTEREVRAHRLFIHPKIRSANHPLKKEKERLRTKTFKPRWAGLLQRPADTLRTVFHNVQSLRAHHPDLTLDMEIFMAADILLLAETWLRPEDHIDLGLDMQQVARCDMAGTGPGHVAGGVAIYSRLPLTEKATLSTLPHIEAVSAGYTDLLVVVIYCHPSAIVDDIIQAIDLMLPGHPLPRTTILAGDFNKEMQQPAGQRIVRTLTERTLTATSCLTAPTTYGAGSTIDAVFSNATAMTVGTYQAYFSHHLPLVIDVPNQ